MKEQLIVLQRQMLYPEKREKIAMPDGTYTPEEQQISQQDLEKRAQEQLKRKEEKKAEAGMWKHVKKEALKKRDAQRAKEVDQEVKPAEDKDQASRSGEKTPEKYFEKAPQEMQSSIDNFCKKAEWIDLTHLDTEFLTYHYLSLRKEAEGKGIRDFTFLSKIEQELKSARRGQIQVIEIAKESDKELNVPQAAVVKNDREFESVKRYWEEQVRKGFITKEMAEAKIAQRIRPVGGGNGEEEGRGRDTTKYPDLPRATGAGADILNPIVEQINNWEDELWKDRSKIEAQIDRIQRLVDDGKVGSEALEILKGLERWQGQARKDEHEEREEEYRKREDRPRGEFYQERRITSTTKKEIEIAINRIVEAYARGEKGNLAPIEALFNRMFDYADSTPQKEFKEALGSPGMQEHHHWITMLNEFRSDAAEKRQIDKLDIITSIIGRFDYEFTLRELLHNTYFIVETGGDPKNFVDYSSRFLSEFADLATHKSPEVEIAYRVREQALYQIKRENNGTISPETVALRYNEEKDRFESDFETRSKELLRKTLKVNGMDLPLWKQDRALSISRGLGMVLLRWPEIIAECTLQAPSDTNESQPSIPWEKLSWELNPLDHKVKRYKIGREIMAVLHAAVNRQHPKRKFLDLWNQDELKASMNLNSITALAEWDRGQRMIDIRNLSRIGGWATYSGWRSWVSALEREGGKVPLALADLQKTLGRNPGLSIRLLWNRYQFKDMGELKKKFLQENASWMQGRDENSEKVLKAWDDYQKTHTTSKEWQGADIDSWKDSAKRIPHIILRILTDEPNKIFSKEETKAILREIFKDEYRNYGEVGYEDFKKIYTQTETDLTLAKERVMKRRRDFREQNPKAEFPEGEDQIKRDDLISVISSTAEDGDVSKRIERALKLKKVVEAKMEDKKLQKILFDKMSNREFAYALTTEDTPLGEFRFVQAGARGLVTRRNNDFLQEIQANGAQYDELLKQLNLYKSPEQVVEQLVKIFKFAEVHDYSRALELIEFWAKGIIRFNQKDGILKVPIFGEIWGALNLLRRRGQSFSQTAYGRSGMSWDSDDIYNFTEQLRKSIFIGEEGYAILQRIRKETGGTLLHAIGKRTKTAFYLLALFFGFEMAKKLVQGK